MSNNIVRAFRPQDPFERILRTTVRDKNLSYRARGVLMRLLSNIDGYRMSSVDLAREGKEGRDSIRTALNELKSERYLVRVIVKNDKGVVIDNYLVVYDEPQNGESEVTMYQQADGTVSSSLPTNHTKAKTSPKKESDPAEAKPFGNFSCEYKDGVFTVGPALLAKLKANYPGVAAERERYNGVEGYLKFAGEYFKHSGKRNQVGKGNWKHSRWLTYFFGVEQEYIGDVAVFGKAYAEERKYKML